MIGDLSRILSEIERVKAEVVFRCDDRMRNYTPGPSVDAFHEVIDRAFEAELAVRRLIHLARRFAL